MPRNYIVRLYRPRAGIPKGGWTSHLAWVVLDPDLLVRGFRERPWRTSTWRNLIAAARRMRGKSVLRLMDGSGRLHRPQSSRRNEVRSRREKLLRIAREGNEPIPVRHSHLGQRLCVEHVVDPDDSVEIKDVGGHRVELIAR